MSTATNLTSTNWSGAIVLAPPGNSFDTVSAHWTVPSITAAPVKGISTSDVASWVGLDGYNSNDVAQAGIQEMATTAANGKTTVSYSAWDEWYPAGSNNIAASAFKVDPGDTIGITVETAGAGSTNATFLFDNTTTGQTYQSSLSAPGGTELVGNSAEWVVETPELSNGFYATQPPLADFVSSPIVFQDASAMYGDGTSASLLGAQTIGMDSYDIPGIPNNTQEAYGTVSSADSIMVTEDDYWSTLAPVAHHSYFA